MTKKDYELIAESIKDVLEYQKRPDHAVTVRIVASNLAFVLKLDNPKFDEDKFLTACGIEVPHCKECDRTNIDYAGVCPNHR